MSCQVVVFHMTPGCAPCEEYIPRFKQIARPYQSRAEIRSVNLAKPNKNFSDLAIRFKVDATPTTIVIDENDRVRRRRVGALSNEDVVKLLEFAAVH